MGGSTVAIVMAMRRRKIIRAYQNAGATTPERAIPLSQVTHRRGLVVRRLIARGVLVPVGSPAEQRFHLDEAAADRYMMEIKRRGRVIIIAMVVTIVVTILLARYVF